MKTTHAIEGRPPQWNDIVSLPRDGVAGTWNRHGRSDTSLREYLGLIDTLAARNPHGRYVAITDGAAAKTIGVSQRMVRKHRRFLRTMGIISPTGVIQFSNRRGYTITTQGFFVHPYDAPRIEPIINQIRAVKFHESDAELYADAT